jgi:hypothetical protein
LFFVLFVFVLCLVYPMLPVSLDCPFLIFFTLYMTGLFYIIKIIWYILNFPLKKR